MVRTHISIPNELDVKVKEYCDLNKLKYSKGVTELLVLGLSNLDINKLLVANNKLLNNISSRQVYIRDLIEQFYSDMEIENLSIPNKNKALQSFKLDRSRDKYND